MTGYRTYAYSPLEVHSPSIPAISQPDVYISTSNSLTVFFYSDEQINAVGFKAKFIIFGLFQDNNKIRTITAVLQVIAVTVIVREAYAFAIRYIKVNFASNVSFNNN